MLIDRSTRYVRLTLPAQDYFHLDEVEVFGPDLETNIARSKPATQSSVSQWSKRGSPNAATTTDRILETIQRGRRLAASQQRLGAPVAKSLAELEDVERALSTAELSASERERLHLRARWTVRQLALDNPLLDFDTILFVKRAPTLFPHMSDQHYGWWSRPGGGVCLLDGFKTGLPTVRCLTEALPAGSFAGPDLSADGRRIFFAYARHYPDLAAERNKADGTRVPEDAYYHLYEMNADGSGLHRLTRGKYDDFDGRYLPDGSIVFLSTRKGTALQSTQATAESTRTADLPMSYVRCGGDNWRPVPVFTLHRMVAEGGHLQPLSAFENFEWAPSLADDGRILYTRWDYIDRFNGDFFSLWSANQDGTIPQLVYGNYTTKPQVVVEARSIPGSSKLVFTAAAHHSITGGSLCLLDRERGTEAESPLTRLTPEVCFPETEGAPSHYFAHPWPLSEEYLPGGVGGCPAAAASVRERCQQSAQCHGDLSARCLWQPRVAPPRLGNLKRVSHAAEGSHATNHPGLDRPMGRSANRAIPAPGCLPGTTGCAARQRQTAPHRWRPAQGPAAHESAGARRVAGRPRQIRARHGAGGSRRFRGLPGSVGCAGIFSGTG